MAVLRMLYQRLERARIRQEIVAKDTEPEEAPQPVK